MILFLYAIILTAYLSDFRDVLQYGGSTASYASLAPELLSMLVLVVIAFRLANTKRLALHSRYLIVGFMFMLLILDSILINEVPSGTVVAGLRSYFKYLPAFALPCVLDIRRDQLSRFLKFILLLALLQAPIAIAQRFLLYRDYETGDVVRGTLSSSGVLSIFLLCAISMTWAFYLRGKIKLVPTLIFLFLLLLPTTINETKGTLVLLPFAIALPAILHRGKAVKRKYVIGSILMGTVLLTAFVGVYDRLYLKNSGGIIEYFASGTAEKNVYKNAELGETQAVGRIDSIIWAYQDLSTDLIKLAVGLGIGNVSASPLQVMKGTYADQFAAYGPRTTTITILLWETGVFGIVLLLVILRFLFKDAAALRSEQGITGTLALGWSAVVVLTLFSLPYKDLTPQNFLGYLFWFFSGYMASQRMRVTLVVQSAMVERHTAEAATLQPAKAMEQLRGRECCRTS